MCLTQCQGLREETEKTCLNILCNPVSFLNFLSLFFKALKIKERKRKYLPSRSLCSNRGYIGEQNLRCNYEKEKTNKNFGVMEKFDISLPKARYFIRDREQKD